MGGSRDYERFAQRFIAFNLEKPPGNDSGSDTMYQRKVRPASRPRLLHLFPLTPADEPPKKKRFFRQEGLPMSEHNPATDLPRNCESYIPFSPGKVPHDWGSDTDPLRVRPMLLCMFPLTPADGEERRQMSEADQGKDVINRSDSNGLGSPTQDLCASPSLEETTSGNPLRSVQFVDPSDISPRETDQHLRAATEVAHFGPEPTNLSNGREVVPFEPESMNLLDWASNGSGFPSSSKVSGENVPHGSGCPFSRLRASRQRTVICAQPVRAMSNSNTRLLAQSRAQSAQPPAQPLAQPLALPPAQPRVLPRAQPLVQAPALRQALSPAQPRVLPRAQPLVQTPALGQTLSPAQPRVLPRAQPLVQTPALSQALSPAQPRVPPPAQPWALSPAQPRALPLTEPRARRQAQPRVQSPAQPRVLPRVQPLVQTPALRHALSPAQPRVPPPAQPWALSPAQPRALPLTEPRARRQAQPRVQSPAQPRVLPRAQPLVQTPALRQVLSPAQPRVLPRVQPLVQTPALSQALPPGQPRVRPPAQPRALPLTEPRARRQAQPRVQSPAQPRAQAPAQPRAQPRVQPRAQPGAQAPTQPQVQPPAQAPALVRAQHGPRPKSSRYKGVTHYKRTGRWEAHLWDDGHQIYLGASLTEIQAARAYDRAAIRFRGVNAEINFLLADYRSELPRLQAITEDELVLILRKQSAGKGTLYPEYPNP